MLLFLVLAGNFAWFRILQSCTLLLKLPVLMCSCSMYGYAWLSLYVSLSKTKTTQPINQYINTYRNTTYLMCSQKKNNKKFCCSSYFPRKRYTQPGIPKIWREQKASWSDREGGEVHENVVTPCFAILVVDNGAAVLSLIKFPPSLLLC